jgi:hypothetical protein
MAIPIYKLTTLFYASNKDFFNEMKTFIDYHDGTLEIEDFEKTCSLAQSDKNELVKIWKEKLKEKKRQSIKEKKKEEETDQNALEVEAIKGDVKKDIENPNAYPECVNAIRECNE